MLRNKERKVNVVCNLHVDKCILFHRLKLYVLYELLGIDESGGLPLIQFWTKCSPRSTSPRIQINTSTTVFPSTQFKTSISVSPCTQQCTSTTVSPGSEKSTRTTTSSIQPIYCVTVQPSSLTSPGNKKYLQKGRVFLIYFTPRLLISVHKIISVHSV